MFNWSDHLKGGDDAPPNPNPLSSSPTGQLLLSPSPEAEQMSTPIQHQRRLSASLYLLTTSLLFADQIFMSPNLSAIAAEFQLDDIDRDKKLGGV